MKLKHTLYTTLIAILMTLLAVGCIDEPSKRQLSFNATTEQWQSDSKVRLDDNEQWIYWELNDEISIASNQDNSIAQGWLYPGGVGDWEQYNGVFIAEMPEGSKYFLALHPYNKENQITYKGGEAHYFNPATIVLPEVQTYRTDEHGDHTFDRSILPMVAWHDKDWTAEPNSEPNLDFHTMASLVRLQFFNESGADHGIKSIKITAEDPGTIAPDEVKNTQLSGSFKLHNQHSANPFLESGSGSSTITIRKKNEGETIDFKQGDLKSFYLVLPAMAGRDTTTVYKLRVEVTNDQDATFSGSINLRTRRRGITYLRAIGINKWDASSADRAEQGLSGNGTEERPFKIYTLADLIYLRNQYAGKEGSGVTINGQLVTANTQFRIVRSDIVLNDQWNKGIEHFVGQLRYAAATPTGTVPGITNRTTHPLFESIDAGGTVQGITLRYDNSAIHTIDAGCSPFCLENNGTIEDCRITSTAESISPTFNPPDQATLLNFGALCLENHGQMINCGNTFHCTLHANIRAAGICYENDGTIQGCYMSSMSHMSKAREMGGIVYTNKSNGEVLDCYYAAHIDDFGTTSWGGICYSNEGLIKHCAIDSNSVLSTSSTDVATTLGGIACSNTGTIDYCWAKATLQAPNVGAIVGSNNNGTVRNCFFDGAATPILTTQASGKHYAGGIAAQMNGGKIENSFVVMHSFSGDDMNLERGSLVGNLEGGTVSNAYGLCTESTKTFLYGHKADEATLNNCHIVKERQDGITSHNRTIAGMDSLTTQLNDEATANSNWFGWERNTTGMSEAQNAQTTPYLAEYTLSSTIGTPRRRHLRH